MSGTRRGGIPGPESRTGLVRPVMTEAEFERAQRPRQHPGALEAVRGRDEATSRGVAYLVETQREDGTWDEPWFTGTGFPGDFYLNYHLYRLTFPVMALGRLIRGGATWPR